MGGLRWGRATDQMHPWDTIPGFLAGHQLRAVPKTRAQAQLAARVKQECFSLKNFTNPLSRGSQGFFMPQEIFRRCCQPCVRLLCAQLRPCTARRALILLLPTSTGCATPTWSTVKGSPAFTAANLEGAQ